MVCKKNKRKIEYEGEIMVKEKRIFRYELADAWGDTISQVDVIENLEKGNVRCLYFERNSSIDDEANTKIDFFTATISCEDISKIKKAMHKHKDIFSFKEVEIPTVLDGVINTFEFILEKNLINEIKAYNIWVFNEAADVAFFGKPEPPYKGKEVVMVYNEISQILMDNGVNEKYLKLC